jgi:glycosyltransferase involved in cell wall biosynthesis
MQTLLHFAQDSDTSGFFPQLARWRDRDRYRMSFGTLNPMAPWLKAHMESLGVPCFSCNCRRRAEYPLGMIRLARYLRREHIDILHTHLFEPSVIGLLAGLLAQTRARVMTRHYSDYHTRINKKWHVRLDRLCTRLSHTVIAVSRHTADHLIEREGARPDKIKVILNGIDLDRVRTSGPDARNRLRRELAPEDPYVLLIAARLHPEKGHHFLFQALPDIQRRVGRPIRLLVAGTGIFEATYKEEVRSVGCEDIVSFLGFRNDIPDLMVAADLLVLPSVAEAFGLVLAEAIHLGLPIVATHVGGIPEIVKDGEDGVLVAPANSQGLSDAVSDLLNDPARRYQISRLRTGRTRFRFEDMVRSYESIYSAVGTRLARIASSQPDRIQGR